MCDRTGTLAQVVRPVLCSRMSRRACLAGALLGMSGGMPSRARGAPLQEGPSGADQQEIEQVQATAKHAGLGVFARSSTEHFLGLGDAPGEFRAAALRLCEQFARVFLEYFAKRGFKAAFPRRRLVVITLKDDASYGAFSGEAPDETVGGHYNLETNRLVVFDFRPRQAGLAENAERVNTFTLVHETAHLLCFNAGLLSRRADVPACVSEGLATFVELWRPRKGAPLGATNKPRLAALLDAGNEREGWLPIAEVLAHDERFEDPKTQQLAYAESWLFAHYLLKTQTQLPKFQAYLRAIPADGPATKRIEYAESQLGSLRKLDTDLKHHGKRELRQL